MKCGGQDFDLVHRELFPAHFEGRQELGELDESFERLLIQREGEQKKEEPLRAFKGL